jgi:hypothetical protein
LVVSTTSALPSQWPREEPSQASLSELRSAPAPSTGRVRVGQPAPDLTLLTQDHSRWSLLATLAGAAEAAAPKPAPAVVLVLFRASAGAEHASGIDAAKGARSALEHLGGVGPFVSAAGVVIELSDFTPERWQEAQSAWAGGSGSPLLWASSGAQTIDRFAPGADAVALVVGPDRALRAAIELAPRAPDAPSVEEALRAALSP